MYVSRTERGAYFDNRKGEARMIRYEAMPRLERGRVGVLLALEDGGRHYVAARRRHDGGLGWPRFEIEKFGSAWSVVRIDRGNRDGYPISGGGRYPTLEAALSAVDEIVDQETEAERRPMTADERRLSRRLFG
jgi:hypothetical protein